jgi:hypothetical protein
MQQARSPVFYPLLLLTACFLRTPSYEKERGRRALIWSKPWRDSHTRGLGQNRSTRPLGHAKRQCCPARASRGEGGEEASTAGQAKEQAEAKDAQAKKQAAEEERTKVNAERKQAELQVRFTKLAGGSPEGHACLVLVEAESIAFGIGMSLAEAGPALRATSHRLAEARVAGLAPS